MTAVELAIYAAETKLLMRVVAGLAAICFAAALLFAFFYGTVRPRLRVAKGRNERLRLENTALRATNQQLKADLSDGAGRVAALEKQAATLLKEVERLNGIRKRTDSSLLQTKALLERLQSVTAHVDLLDEPAAAAGEPASRAEPAPPDESASGNEPGTRPDPAPRDEPPARHTASNDDSARPARPDRSARRQRPI